MLEIKDLCFKFDESGEKLFSSLSLSIKKGEIVLLMGESGSGKTTLAKILTGGVPKYSGGTLSGDILINEQDLLALDIAERMKLVGRVAQNTDEMILFSTVEAELSFPLENLGLAAEDIKNIIDKTLDIFELSKYKDVSTSELSGGEKRRLMCAILFEINPDLLIFDESFDELSPRWREKLRTMIKNSGKSTIVLGSHDLSSYKGLYDRILVIENGKILNYQEEKIDKFSYSLPDFLNCGQLDPIALVLDNIKLIRHHRSISEATPFSIDIPHFSIKQGSAHILMGDNGAGKSTLANLICGLLKEDSGTITIDNKRTNIKERRVKVAYLMQNPFEQLFLPTVYDELKSTDASEDDINRALGLFGLNGNWYISEIPYGKAKLVQAAVFYLLDRPFIILDELDSAMNYNESLMVVKAFLEKGCGLLIITHDEKFANILSFDRYFMEGGKICR